MIFGTYIVYESGDDHVIETLGASIITVDEQFRSAQSVGPSEHFRIQCCETI